MGNPAGPPPPVQPDGQAIGPPVDLRQLITESMADRPAPVNAHTYVRKWDSASKPVALKCDDGNVYVVKARQPANPGMHRSIANEQMVGSLGILIQAPIPRIVQVEVPADLVANQPEMAHMSPGLAHGSLFADDLSERFAISHDNVPENRGRFALLAVLYGWVVASDHQFFYAKSAPPLVYSVDHAYFFPGQSGWTIQSLAQVGPPEPDQTIVQACNLTPQELQTAIGAISATDERALACTVALPPDEWGMTMDERLAVLEFLIRRRDILVGPLPAQQNQGE
jgi:hypothetical protein